MLFTPWRNEETDLKGKYSSYKEHNLALSDQVTEQMKQYAICGEDLNEMQQHLNPEDIDKLDFIAPVTQLVECEDENEGN